MKLPMCGAHHAETMWRKSEPLALSSYESAAALAALAGNSSLGICGSLAGFAVPTSTTLQ